MIINKKTIKTADLFLLVQFLILLTLLIWLAEIKVTPLRGVQYMMIFWFYIVYLKGYRLTQAISAIDSEVVNNIKSTNKEILKTYREWTYYSKKVKKISVPVSISLLVFAVVSIIFHIPINIFKDVFLLILFVDIMIYGLSRSIVIKEFIREVLELYGKIYPDIKNSDKTIISIKNEKITNKFIEGFLISIIFVIILYYFFKMSTFNYFLYYLAFSVLYSLSRTLIMMHRYFLNTLNLIDSIRLGGIAIEPTEKGSSNP